MESFAGFATGQTQPKPAPRTIKLGGAVAILRRIVPLEPGFRHLSQFHPPLFRHDLRLHRRKWGAILTASLGSALPRVALPGFPNRHQVRVGLWAEPDFGLGARRGAALVNMGVSVRLFPRTTAARGYGTSLLFTCLSIGMLAVTRVVTWATTCHIRRQHPHVMAVLNNVIISGGGTGGHIHPALAIPTKSSAEIPSHHSLGRPRPHGNGQGPCGRVRHRWPWISGIDRSLTSTRNLSFPFKLVSSLWKARRLLRAHRPQAVVGVGGFASGPLLDQAVRKGIPTLIQEQNSFPGITNRLLANRVDRICAGLPGLDRWFPKERIVHTGNPLRAHVCALAEGQDAAPTEALAHWGLSQDLPVVFVMGGSLGLSP